MIGLRKKKEEPIQRSPQIVRQKQSVFHYSSNRTGTERIYNRGESIDEEDKSGRFVELRIVKLGAVIATVALIAGSVFLAVLSGSSKVVFVDSEPIRLQSEYTRVASEASKQGLGGLLKFTINRQEIADKLQKTYPELQDVDVTTPVFSQQVVIKARVSEPAMILKSGSRSYLLDNRGMAILDTRKTELTTGVDSLLKIDDASQTDIEIGKPALTSTQVNFIRELKLQSDAQKIEIESMTLTPGGGELQVKYKDINYIVKYNLYEDARTSFGTFAATKEYMESSNEAPKEYVDVRIPERAYVR